MHVENLAIFDEVYESNMFRSVINNSDMPVASNLSQVAAVGSICNSAVADASNTEEENLLGKNKGFVGNATGKHIRLFAHKLLALIMPLDVAILRFSDTILSAQEIRRRWVNIFRRNFSSKVRDFLRYVSSSRS